MCESHFHCVACFPLSAWVLPLRLMAVGCVVVVLLDGADRHGHYLGLCVWVRFYIHNLHTHFVLYLGLISPFAGLVCSFTDFLIWSFILFKFRRPKVSESLYCTSLHLLLLCRSSQFVGRLHHNQKIPQRDRLTGMGVFFCVGFLDHVGQFSVGAFCAEHSLAWGRVDLSSFGRHGLGSL